MKIVHILQDNLEKGFESQIPVAQFYNITRASKTERRLGWRSRIMAS